MLAAENRELQKQIEYGDQKLEQAKKYLDYDKNNLLKYGATFDAQGNLNYAEYEKLWFDKWNANESAWASFAIDDDAREEFLTEDHLVNKALVLQTDEERIIHALYDIKIAKTISDLSYVPTQTLQAFPFIQKRYEKKYEKLLNDYLN